MSTSLSKSGADFRSELKLATSLPSSRSLGGDAALVIYDDILSQKVPGFAGWLRGFRRRYGVKSGERLKDVAAFPRHAERLLELADGVSRAELRIVAVGGGTVGDFAGFVASLLRRGVRLVHIPSTWLAAMDSAHGGKTALNVGSYKNQIGTFHPAESVVLVRKLLAAQGPERAEDAMGELVKMALLSGRPWARELLAQATDRRRPVATELCWKYLREAIEAKYRVVEQDPLEKKGLREILNLGHTAGHVFEVAYGLSHGTAVGAGLRFALEWSWAEDLMSGREFQRLSQAAEILLPSLPRAKPMSRERFEALLRKDKKASGKDRLRFVFLEGFGQPVRLEVSVSDVVREAQSQGWVL